MIARAFRAVSLAVLLAIGAGGCVTKLHFRRPVAEREWPGQYLAAQAAADRGSFGDADQTLARFAQSHPDTPEAAEAGYWRAVYKLDPANKDANTRDAIAGLDRYLASSGGSHRGEATTLRRLAVQLLALDRALTAKPEDAAAPARDEEVKKLKDELQATKDELERIKRRLAAPKP